MRPEDVWGRKLVVENERVLVVDMNTGRRAGSVNVRLVASSTILIMSTHAFYRRKQPYYIGPKGGGGVDDEGVIYAAGLYDVWTGR